MKVTIPEITIDLPDGMAIPQFNNILADALRELINKFPDYENSWMEYNEGFWIPRLTNEVEEYGKALTPAARRRKAVNIFNLAAMAYQNANLLSQKKQIRKE